MFRLSVSASGSSPSSAAAPFAAPPPSRRLIRRAVRAGFGQGLLVGAVVAVGWWVWAEELPGPVPHNVAWWGIVTAWLWALGGAALARVAVASGAVRRALGDDGLARAAFVLPAVGLAVMAPLSLQAMVGSIPVMLGENFDAWVGFALAGTVHVHVAFAISMGLMAWRLSLGQPEVKATLWPSVLLSLVPGALILFPPLLVWGTGFIISRAFAAHARRWFLDDQVA